MALHGGWHSRVVLDHLDAKHIREVQRAAYLAAAQAMQGECHA